MKNNYELYKPSKLIRDFHTPPDGYFQSKDVTLSPFTKVGSLVDIPEPAIRPNVPRESSATHYTQPAVFPRDFVLPGFAGSRQAVDRATVRANHTTSSTVRRTRITTTKTLAAFGAFLKKGMHTSMVRLRRLAIATMATMSAFSYTIRHFQPTTKKYVADKGLQKDFSGKAATLGKIVVLGLGLAAVVLLIEVLHLLTGPTFFPSTPKQQTNPAISTTSTAHHAASPNTRVSNPNGSASGTNTVDGTVPSLGDSPVSILSSSSGTTGSIPISNTSGSSAPGSSISIPGVTYPYPITVPGTTIPLGDKQLVGTSPTTITLN